MVRKVGDVQKCFENTINKRGGPLGPSPKSTYVLELKNESCLLGNEESLRFWRTGPWSYPSGTPLTANQNSVQVKLEQMCAIYKWGGTPNNNYCLREFLKTVYYFLVSGRWVGHSLTQSFIWSVIPTVAQSFIFQSESMTCFNPGVLCPI